MVSFAFAFIAPLNVFFQQDTFARLAADMRATFSPQLATYYCATILRVWDYHFRSKHFDYRCPESLCEAKLRGPYLLKPPQSCHLWWKPESASHLHSPCLFRKSVGASTVNYVSPTSQMHRHKTYCRHFTVYRWITVFCRLCCLLNPANFTW